MASNGTFNTSVATYSGHAGYPDYATFSWVQTKDEANNQSIINYSLKAKLSSGTSTTNYTYVRTRKLTVTIDGVDTVLQNTDTKKKVVKDTVIFSGSFVVPAHADGTSSFTASIRLALYSSSVNSTGSATFTLDSLDHADTFTMPATYTINNITQNTFGITATPSKTPRTYDLSYTLNGNTVQVWSQVTATAEKSELILNLDLLTAMSNVASAVLTMTLTTYYEGNLIGSYSANCNITVNLNSVKPSFSGNLTVTPLSTPISGYLIAGYSSANINGTLVMSAGSSSATIKTRSISFGTLPADVTATTGGAKSVPTAIFPQSASDLTVTAVIYAVDSRGAVSDDYTVTFSVYGYTKPTITGNFYRVEDNTTTPPVPDEAGQWVYCDYSASITSINNQNTLTISCTYAGETSGTATNHSWIALSENGTLTFTVTATDRVSQSVNTFTVLMAIFPIDLTQEYTSTGTEVGATIGGIAELGKFKSMLPSYFPAKAFGPGIIEYIKGDQSSSTSSWTGDTEQDALYEGMTIMYYLPEDSTASNVTLNLSFPDGSSSGAKNVYYQGNVRMADQYDAYSQILLTYHENYEVNGTSLTGWWHDADKGGGTVACAICTSTGATVDKVAEATGYALRANNLFVITFTEANSATSFTLNVNETGAKAVYINGEANGSGNTNLPAGTYLCYYDGTRYYLRTDGRIPTPSEVESGVITRSSGGTLNYAHGYRNNNVITIYGKVSYSTLVASGSNIFEGTISAKYYPPYDVETFAYYQGHAIGIRIQPTGEVTVRNASSSSVTINDGIYFSATYVVYDSTLNENAIVPSVSQNSTTGVVTIS